MLKLASTIPDLKTEAVSSTPKSSVLSTIPEKNLAPLIWFHITELISYPPRISIFMATILFKLLPSKTTAYPNSVLFALS